MTTSLALGQMIIPYTAPKVYKLNSPYRGDFYNFLSYRYDVAANFVSNNVGQIVEDHYGRIWFIGNGLGFGCLDGEYLYHFGSHNGFFDRQTDIFADDEGGIWVGGNGTGIYHLEKPGVAELYVNSLTFPLDSTCLDISDVHINSINKDKDGNIWVATGLGGLTCYTKDTILFLSPGAPIEPGSCKHLTCDAEGLMWFTCKKHLWYVKDFELHERVLPPEIGEIETISLGDHDFILASTSSGPYKINLSIAEKLEFKTKPHEPVSSGLKAPDGTIYMRSDQTVYKYENDELLQVFESKNEFRITYFFVDSGNNIWISTNKIGLVCLPNFTVKRFPDYKVCWNEHNRLVVQDESHVFELKLDSNQHESSIIHFYLKPEEIVERCLMVENGFYYQTNLRGMYYNEVIQTCNEVKLPDFVSFRTSSTYKDYYVFQSREHYLSVLTPEKEWIQFPYPSKYQVSLFYASEKGLYFLDGSHEYNANVIRYHDNQLDTVFYNLGGDSLKITGAIYLSDTSLIVSSWGRFFMKIAPSGVETIKENVSSNILYGNFIDFEGNFWTSGIEGGVTYLDSQTGKAAKYTPANGFPGVRAGRFGLSYCSLDVLIPARSGIAWMHEQKSIPIHTQSDFYEKYDIRIFSWVDGLYGQDFNQSFMNDQGVILVNGNDSRLQAIYPNFSDNPAPHNLHFKSVKSENRDREIYYFYQWYPGVIYDPVSQIEISYTENLLIDISSIFFDDFFNQTYSYRIDTMEWSLPSHSPQFRLAGLPSGDHVLSFVAYSGTGKASEQINLNIHVTGPIYESFWFWALIITLVLLIFFLIFRWRTYLIRARANALEHTVKERTAEIEHQKIEIETQHNEIKDSIQYAKRLQDAILPSHKTISQHIPEHFVLFKPKDVVSGDFYWFEHVNGTSYIAVADCTGHGVPGALVSVVCSNALNRTLNEFQVTEPNEILNKTRELVIETFSKSTIGVKDGMDIGLCAIRDNKVLFSGANNPLWIVRKKELIPTEMLAEKGVVVSEDFALIEIKGDKQPVGLFAGSRPFTVNSTDVLPGDIFYLLSDGYADQFGGENHSVKKPGGKKLKYAPLKKMLLELGATDLTEQEIKLEISFNNWRGSFEQVDDVCITGFKIL